MDTITKETLERYLNTSQLTDEQKKTLLSEFETSGGNRQVLNKAVQLNGRKSMTKVPSITHK